MFTINPLDLFLWTARRNERDVARMYDYLSGVMQLATGADMLNFGYWTRDISDPISAQENLCRELAMLAGLDSAGHVADLGSGLSGPAKFWQGLYPGLELYPVNVSLSQLRLSGRTASIHPINCTSTCLPFPDGMMDRVLALESSQHFKPYKNFVSESRRILKPSGVLALCLPVLKNDASASDLGLLNFTWSSEHYTLDMVRSMLQSGGFEIHAERLVGGSVYGPLADYYIGNRHSLRDSILQKYPSYVEKILCMSVKRMKRASDRGIIEYAMFCCTVK